MQTICAEYSGIDRRTSDDDAILRRGLLASLKKINPTLPDDALELAYAEIVRDRSSLTPENANRELSLLFANGVKVTYRDADGNRETDTVRVIDWRNLESVTSPV